MSVKPENHVDTQKMTWFSEEGYRMLLYSAIAAAFPDGYCKPLRLCTGLPVNDFKKHRTKLEKILNRKHHFVANGIEYDILLRQRSTVVMPQPYGLYVSAVIERSEWSDQLVGVLDIGSYTSDWTIVENLKVREFANGGAAVGVWTIVNEVKAFLHEQLGATPGTQDLLNSINAGKYRHFDHDIDLSGVIRIGTMKGTERLVEHLSDSWRDSGNLRIVVGGGGSSFFAKSLSITYPHAVVLDSCEPFMNIVEGYYTYLARSNETEKVASSA